MPATPPEAGRAPDAGVPHGSSRRTPRWLLAVAGVLLVARIAGAIDEARRDPELADLIPWRPIAQAPALALASGKPILYDFTAEWCPPCKMMGRELFSDQRSAKTIESMFVPVRVLDRMREEGRNAPAVATLQQRYRVEAFPTLVIVAPDGREVGRIEGYAGKAATLARLTQARNAATAPRR